MVNVKTGYKVCDAMTKKLIMVNQDMTIVECAQLMARENVGSLVIGERKKLEGIITEQDMVRKVLAEKIDPNIVPVSKIMVKRIFTVSPEIDLFDAIQLMNDYSIRYMPVIARSKIVGYLTLRDVLRIQPQLCELIIDKFSIREESEKPVFESSKDLDKFCPVCGK